VAGRRAALASGPDEVTALPAYPGRFDTAQIANAEEISARLKHAPGWLVDARAANASAAKSSRWTRSPATYPARSTVRLR
jgi:hypothetical protein